MSRKPLASTLLWAFLILTAPFAAQPEVTTPGDAAPAIGGYSPVSYFTVGRPEKGSPRYTSTHEGKVYWLTSAEQVQRFEADPDTYAPVFPDHCPYSLSLGRAVAIDPRNFLIMGDNLLLFHDSAEMDTIARELKAEGPDKMLDRARSNLMRMQF
jgi:hypothetical protein